MKQGYTLPAYNARHEPSIPKSDTGGGREEYTAMERRTELKNQAG